MAVAIVTDELQDLHATMQKGDRLYLTGANHTPAAGDSLSDYTTDEANFSGYSNQSVSFLTPTASGSTSTSYMSCEQFVHNGGGTSDDVYAMALAEVAPSPDWLIGGHRFSGAPISMASAQDEILVRIVHKLHATWGSASAGDFTVADDALDEELDGVVPTDTVGSTKFLVRLYTDGFTGTPSNSDDISDYSSHWATEGGMSGAANLYWASDATVASNIAEKLSNLVSFQRSSTGTTETIKGFALLTSSGAVLVGAENFSSTIPVTNAGDKVDFKVKVRLQGV